MKTPFLTTVKLTVPTGVFLDLRQPKFTASSPSILRDCADMFSHAMVEWLTSKSFHHAAKKEHKVPVVEETKDKAVVQRSTPR